MLPPPEVLVIFSLNAVEIPEPIKPPTAPPIAPPDKAPTTPNAPPRIEATLDFVDCFETDTTSPIFSFILSFSVKVLFPPLLVP